jgi:small subunit ribosomal protein S20
LAHSSRTWSGARTPSALKRARQSPRRNAVLQPRRTAAKSQVKNALSVAAGGDAEATRKAVAEAAAALDRAAKAGAIHPNNAARRKSRLMRRANAALGGESLTVVRKPQRQVSKAAAAKAAKARIAASKAAKAKGEQTAAGKARAALSKSARSTDTKKTTTKKTTTTKAKSTNAKKTTAKAKSTTAKKTTAKKTTKKEE